MNKIKPFVIKKGSFQQGLNLHFNFRPNSSGYFYSLIEKLKRGQNDLLDKISVKQWRQR